MKEYKAQTGFYPIQKDERVDGRQVLIKALVTDTKILNTIPQDPKSQDNWDYRYWSEGSVYSFRYLLESNPRQEQLVYGQ